MRKMITLATALILLFGMAATPVLAADATAAIDVNSAYVWRGLTFNDGVVIQPSIDVAAKNGLGINVWDNYNINVLIPSMMPGEKLAMVIMSFTST